ncbi:DUF4190 domain-containing protein [Mycobacterium sp. IDR2000157661]|uniref:DUF4190 domain-containing protein n=1 Tax=Mycobacterium sp. IDR2000157661 TaxID=2867005 RepID=UPI001EE9E28C|nr:DUF4190 domain-containing protein [Mycobacterium sp. IDR2000157661]ULE32628.1 DUF4190 domain-containing protein [Mycobacterium sp. IDR2000157661]
MSEPDKPETPSSPSPSPPPPGPSGSSAPPPPQYGAYPGGYPPPPQQQPYAGYPPPPRGPQNGLGIASLVVAIIALLSVFGGVVLGVVAVILGFLGWNRAKRGEATNGGMAVAGIVLGFLSIIEAIVFIGLAVWGFGEVGGTDYIDCLSNAGNDQQAIDQCAEQFQQRVEDEFSVTLTPTP